MNNEQKDSVIAFLDILGFKNLVESEEDAAKLFSVIKNIREQNISESTVKHRRLDDGIISMEAKPALTSFSDCIVLSLSLEDFQEPYDIRNAVTALLHYIQQLADSLINGGYLLRGGITKGSLYHKNGVVFGSALMKAYELESTKAKNPRILVSNDLADEYKKTIFNSENYLLADNINNENEEFCLDYLKLSFQDRETRYRYKKTTDDIITKRRNDLIENVNKDNLDQLEKDIIILNKWICFKDYVDKSISRCE